MLLWGFFPISPHNEGNNKHGYIVTTFWFKLDRGGRGEGWGKGKVEGVSHLKIHFHGDRCKRAITVKGFSFFSQRDTEMLLCIRVNNQYKFCFMLYCFEYI